MFKTDAMAGRYIALAGIDGAGKSTQSGLLAKRIHDEGLRGYCAEEQDRFVNELIKSYAGSNHFLGPREILGHHVVDMLKAVDLIRDYATIVLPLVQMGVNVVVPRSAHCRVGLARALGSEKVDLLRSFLYTSLRPEITIYLRISPSLAQQRVRARGTDDEELTLLADYARALDAELLDTATCVVDAAAPVAHVHQQIWSHVQPILGATKHREAAAI